MKAVYAGYYCEDEDEYYVLYNPDAHPEIESVMVVSEDHEIAGSLVGAPGRETEVDDDFFMDCYSRNGAPTEALNVLAEYEEDVQQ